MRGQPIYNTAVQSGDVMDLHVSQGLPKADNLSAWEPDEVAPVEVEKEVFGKLKILYYTPDGALWIGGDRRSPRRIGTWKEGVFYTLQNQGDGNRFTVAYADYTTGDAVLGWVNGRSETFTGIDNWVDNGFGGALPGGVFVMAPSPPTGASSAGWSNRTWLVTGWIPGTNYPVTYSDSAQREGYVLYPDTTLVSTISKSADYVDYLPSDDPSVTFERMFGSAIRSDFSEFRISKSITYERRSYYERINTESNNNIFGRFETRYTEIFPQVYGVDGALLYIKNVDDAIVVDLENQLYVRESQYFVGDTPVQQPPSTRATLRNGTLYVPTPPPQWSAVTSVPVDIHRVPDWAKTTVNTPIAPIRQDAAVLDWSYHP